MNHSKATLAAAGLAIVIAGSNSASAQCDSYTFTSSVHATGNAPGAIDFGDVNGDGLLDVAVSDATSGTLALLLARKGVDHDPAIVIPAGWRPRAVEFGDFDNDGDLDLAICNEGFLGRNGWQDFGMTVLWNTKGGNFTSSTFTPLPPSLTGPSDVALGDLNGDGFLDAVLAIRGDGYQKSKVASLLGDGSGSFARVRIAETGFGPAAIVLGDLDGDGVLDAVTADTPGNTVSVLRGNGDGGFDNCVLHPTPAYASDIVLGDFTGDGRLDAAVACRYGVQLLLNKGGLFSWVSSLRAGSFATAVAFADLDGDGALDLLAVDYIENLLTTWVGDGSGGFTPSVQFPVGKAPIAVATTDLDSDGDFDVGVVLASGGGAQILRNDCPISVYCEGKTNSLGCTPTIQGKGTRSLSGPNNFHVMATDELSNRAGFAFFGVESASLPFGGGTLCVQPPLVRSPLQDSGGRSRASDCSGVYDFHVSNAWIAEHGWTIGNELFAQYWSRDPRQPDGSGVALTNALRFTLLP